MKSSPAGRWGGGDILSGLRGPKISTYPRAGLAKWGNNGE